MSVSPETLCPIEGCVRQGVYSLTEALQTISPTTDQPLLFCQAHFPSSLELYSLYKGLESMKGWMCLFCCEEWWKQIQKQDGNNVFLFDLLHTAELSLSLRERFQSQLKESVDKGGHLHWMGEMEDG